MALKWVESKAAQGRATDVQSTAGHDGPPTKRLISLFSSAQSPRASIDVEAEETMMSPGDAQSDLDYEVKEQDLFLPIPNIARIMKTAIGKDAKVSEEAIQCIQECVGEFISFVTSDAAEKCRRDGRKIITGYDVLSAFETLGLEHYAQALRIYIARYREDDPVRGPKLDVLGPGEEAAPDGSTTAGIEDERYSTHYFSAFQDQWHQ